MMAAAPEAGLRRGKLERSGSEEPQILRPAVRVGHAADHDEGGAGVGLEELGNGKGTRRTGEAGDAQAGVSLSEGLRQRFKSRPLSQHRTEHSTVPRHWRRASGYRAGVWQGFRDHAARFRCPAVAGLHPDARRPPPVGGNESLNPCHTPARYPPARHPCAARKLLDPWEARDRCCLAATRSAQGRGSGRVPRGRRDPSRDPQPLPRPVSGRAWRDRKRGFRARSRGPRS